MNPENGHQDDPVFKLLFEASPHPYLILVPDAAFTIAAANDRYLAATGTRREAIVGHGLFEIFPDNPDDHSGSGVSDLHISLNRVLSDRRQDIMGVQKYDIPLRDGSGGFEVKYWSPVNTPVFGPDDAIAFIIHHVEDVTDFILNREHASQENAERLGKVEARAERMEAEVLHRAGEVKETNRVLKAAMEALERRETELARLNERLRELDRIKTQFFANVSHELRTPLTLILGPVGKRLAAGGLAEAERRDLEVVERNAHLLYRHVSDLLDVAKLEAGCMRMCYVRADLAWMARLMASMFHALASEKAIDLDVETPEVLPAQVDAEKIQRVLLNLLSNAFKFTPDGGAVALAVRESAGQAVIQIQDNGPGVPTPLREAIFEPFRQGDGGASRQYGGTGLGLAIVREFVTLHGGTVKVEDAPSGGALFTATLPLAAPAGTVIETPAEVLDEQLLNRQAVEELRPQRRRAGGEPAVATDAPLILVVEDNPDMNTYVAEALGGRYRVARAFDGQEGLNRALEVRPDLIVSDVMMPGMSGDEMVRALRGLPETKEIPIVMLTAKADDAFRVQLLAAGVQDYIHKPFAVEELLARVESIVQDRRSAAARLRERDIRFETTFEQAAVGIAHVAPDGRWLWVNRKLCEIVGHNREELLARTFQDITYPDDLDIDLANVRQMLAGAIDTYSMEKRYRRKDGGLVWINLTVALAWKADGAPDYFIAVIEDIQRRKRAEEEIRRLNAGLERRVAERTTELSAANRELESFAYAVSHDLRAPLRAMSGFSHALVEDYGDKIEGEAKGYLDQIGLASRKMGELIDGILALSRSTRGELRRDSIDISALATRLLEELKRSEPERKVSWQVEPDLRAMGDARMIEAVLRNLLGNAWKYTAHAAAPSIRVYAEDHDGAHCYCVADNGAGFDMAHAGQLFKPFQRLHRQDEFPGIGIGLATVQRIVHRHGGEIRAHATPGEGATFCFTLLAGVPKETS